MIMEGEWSYEKEWFEEGNVSKKIKSFLEEEGYTILKFNVDTRKEVPI